VDTSPQRPADTHGLGRPFQTLWAATTSSNLGDGVWLVAAPLLAVTLTRDPTSIAGLAVAQRLPWLLFGLIGGAISDRLDRRRTMVAVALARAVLVALLGIAVLADQATMLMLYVVFFLIAVGETLFDTSASALVPSLVPRELLITANARLDGAFTIANQFVGPPLGGVLFARATSLPFLLGAGGLAAAVGLLATLRGDYRAERATDSPRTTLRGDVIEGLRWLWGQRLLRTITITMAILNFTLVAQVAIMVLVAEQRLGLSPGGYGLLLTAYGAGGVLGGFTAERILNRISEGRYMRLALVIETVAPAIIALTSSGWVVGAVFVAFGFHAIVWGAVLTSLRQELTPDRLRGRIASVHAVLEYGAGAPAALLGGLLAASFGLTAPFWLGAVAGVLLMPLVWNDVSDAAIRAARAANSDQPPIR